MKSIVFVLFAPFLLYTQEDSIKYEDNYMVALFDHQSVSGEELYHRALASISNNYKRAKYVIDYKDVESKKIIIESSSNVLMENHMKLVYPKMKERYVPKSFLVNISYKINFDFKDNRYRAVYELINSTYDYGFQALAPMDYSLIFEENNELDSIYQLKLIEKTKGAMLGKEKKELFVDSWFEYRKKWISNLRSDAILTLKLINDGISKNSILKENSILNEDF